MEPVVSLGRILVELELVRSDQLGEVTAVAHDLDTFLDVLGQQPAWWWPAEQAQRSGKSPPALSPFQCKLIRKKGSAGSWEGLQRALRLRHYLILDRVGQGGMGVVYKAWDLTEQRYVAIKKIKIDDPVTRRRLQTEFKAMQRLTHPAAVRAIEKFRAGTSDVLVMDYQNAGDLTDLVARQKRLGWRQVAQWAADLLGVLEYAHGLPEGIVHRDIKPSNVMVHRTADRVLVRLSDWGLAKVRDEASTSGHTKAGQILGSFQYMSPEQWRGAEYALPASDLYCLGGTLYYALTAKPPFSTAGAGEQMAALCKAHTLDKPPAVRAARPDVPDELDRLLQQMMAKDPAQRGTALTLRLRFLGLLESHAGRDQRTSPSPARLLAHSKPPEPARSVTLPAPSPLAAPSTPVAAMPARPLSPAELRAAREGDVPLLSATRRLVAAAWYWATLRSGSDGRQSDLAATQLAASYRVFGRSLRSWLASLSRPHRHPIRFLTALALAGGVVYLLGKLIGS